MRKQTMPKRICAALTTLAVCSAISAAVLPVYSMKVQASGEVPLSLEQAQALAFANSKSYKKIQTKISLQKVKYADAVKSVALKQKNMSTFRWTPLLSFKFPEWPDLADSYEWQYKPIQIQCQLTTLWHELVDVKYEITEKVSNLYVQAYISQEKITSAAGRKEALYQALQRNQALYKTGGALQADIDKMEQSVKKLDSGLSLRQRELENTKAKLTELLRLDLTSGYRLENPMVTARLERSALQSLTDCTLENDQGYYEAKMNTRLGMISLELNEKLMNSQYGSTMNLIRPYINQAKQGQEIDADAFKAAYDSFLNKIEEPWNGSRRILFIKIPKEWFKGSLDGARYIEDDPYALYTAALEYIDLKNEEESVKSELKTNVSDSFEAIVTAQNAYLSLAEEAEKQERTVEKALLKNQLGELSYEELANEQESFESLQMDALDALAAASGLIYSFDRLTCGGITKYLSGELTGAQGAFGGDSFLIKEAADGASYYIRTKAEDNLFLFGIIIPEDYSLNVTDYELWVNGTRIGDRTASGSALKHLTLTLDGIDQAAVRLYDGEDFLDECEIDPVVSSGKLEVTGGYQAEKKKAERTVASFSCSADAATGMITLRFYRKAGERAASYQIVSADGKPVYQEKKVPVEEAFTYLSLAGKDLENLRVEFFDAQGEHLYTARLKESTMEAVADEE